MESAKITAGSSTEADYRRAMLPWLQRHLGEPFLQRAAGKPWEKEGREFVVAALEHWEAPSVYEARFDLATRGENLVKEGCDDPLVQLLAARLRYAASYDAHWHRRVLSDMMGVRRFEPVRAAEEMKKACGRLEAAGAGAGVRRLVLLETANLWRAANATDQDEKNGKAANALLSAALKDGSYRLPEEEGLLIGHLVRAPATPWMKFVPTDLADDLGAYNLSDWAQECIRGCVDYAHGYPFANTASEHWAAAQRGAIKRWAAAWRLRPDRPEPAFAVFYMSKSGGTPDDESPTVWFERMAAAQFDFPAGYKAMLTNLRSEWYGGEDSLARFGRACAATGRFDTAVPLLLVEALKKNARYGAGRPAFRERENAAALVTMARGMVAAPSRAAQVDLWRSLLAVWAWAAGDASAAAEALEKLPGGTLHPAAQRELREFATTFADMKAEVAVRNSPARQDLDRAQLQIAESELPAAREFLHAALAQAPAAEGARLWLQRELALVEFEQAFAKGGWVQVPTDIALWHVLDGAWSNPAEGTLMLTGDGRSAHIRFRGRTSVNLEFRGEYQSAEGTKEPGQLELGIAFRCRADHDFEQFSTWARDAGKLNVGLRQGFFNAVKGRARPVDVPDATAPRAAVNTFHLRTDFRLSSLKLNDKSVYRDVQNLNIAPEWLKGQASIGFAARALAVGHQVLIRKLEVRLLAKPPALQKEPESEKPRSAPTPPPRRVSIPPARIEAAKPIALKASR